jgi:hypothetical protein
MIEPKVQVTVQMGKVEEETMKNRIWAIKKWFERSLSGP